MNATYSIWVDYESDNDSKYRVQVFDEDNQETDYTIGTRRNIATYDEAEKYLYSIVKGNPHITFKRISDFS